MVDRWMNQLREAGLWEYLGLSSMSSSVPCTITRIFH